MSRDASMPIRLVRDVEIPMRDGVRLSGNLYLPEKSGKYPGIVDYNPYHKDGAAGIRYGPYYRHWASRGYAAMMVDFRGVGSSEGKTHPPFDVGEGIDAHDIVEWMASQPWCTGSVGMWGLSYGGCTALAAAATHPPHLRAIIPIACSTDNYDVIRVPNGCQSLLVSDFDSGSTKVAYNLMPPIAQDGEGAWATRWREQLEDNSPWIFDWHGEPPTSDYWWRSRTPMEQIDVPTFMICGWRDLEPHPTVTIFNAVTGPKRALLGPWKHELPDQSPAVPVGGLHEMDRWFDRWLKGVENGVDAEPPITIYVQEKDEWRYETEWPIERTQTTKYHLEADGSMSPRSPQEASIAGGQRDEYVYDARVGTRSVAYNAHRFNLALPEDQSADDMMSLTYTTTPLDNDHEITGELRARIFISATVGHTNLVGKLCVVDRQGRSKVISAGYADTTRATAHAAQLPLEAGEIRAVEITFRPTSYWLRSGERLRLALAGTDFPELWPTPEPYTMTVYFGADYPSHIEIPFVPPRSTALPTPVLQPAATDLVGPENLGGESVERVQWDLTSRSVCFEGSWSKEFRIDEHTRLIYSHHGVASTDADRPWSTTLRTTTRCEIRRPVQPIVTTSTTVLSPFFGQVAGEIFVDGELFYSKTWEKDFRTRPRDETGDDSSALLETDDRNRLEAARDA